MDTRIVRGGCHPPSMPIWLVITLAIGTPVLAFAGSFIGHAWTRKTATELDVWRRREETMRLLRWAAELAVDQDALRADLGVAVLAELDESELLQPPDQPIVTATLDLVVAGRAITSAPELESYNSTNTDPEEVPHD